MQTVSLILYKTLAGLLIFATSLIAIIYPIKIRAHPKHHRTLELADAFASGIFLGAALFHMLPNAIQEFQLIYKSNLHFPLAEFYCATGFSILLFLERLTSIKSSEFILAYMLTIILIVHALIEGAVLGINTTFISVFIIFIAILVHKSSESFALAVTLNRHHLSLKHIIVIVSIFSLMTPLGILLGTTMAIHLPWQTSQMLIAIFNAFAAGTFLYMSTLHHINHHHHQHHYEGLVEFVCLLIGLGIMGGVAFWA